MTDDRLRAVFAVTGPVLLDFDGPVTQLLPPPANAEIASAVREPILNAGYALPPNLLSTNDHIALLRFAAGVDTATRQAAESIGRDLEVKAGQKSRPTMGAGEFMEACRVAGRPVVIASNNDADAVEAYLDRLGISYLIAGIVGRPRGHPELMKPDPRIVRDALKLIAASPEEAVMIGDSATDVSASQACGVRIIGYAKHSKRGRELLDAGADALVASLLDIVALA